MKKTWRGSDVLPPTDDDLKLVINHNAETTLARYIDEMWIDEYTNRIIHVRFWMPIPIAPNE
jgi:2-phospho-L-lactate transferase/gluconeogenesis factor (CofD/UPF0052 family)